MRLAVLSSTAPGSWAAALDCLVRQDAPFIDGTTTRPVPTRIGPEFWENCGMGTPRRKYATRSKKGLTSPCKSCRRRIRPELLDKTFLCKDCKNDPAAKWLAARTSEKPAPKDTVAMQRQRMQQLNGVNPVTIRWIEPIKPA